VAAIIFDFDGTIADTFEAVIGIFQKLTGNNDPVDPVEVERLRGMSLMHAAEDLHIRPWKMPFLLLRGRRQMGKQIKSIQAHREMPETIRKLQHEGHQLFIVSSNSTRNIQTFLRQHDMAYEFVRIYGGAGLFNKGRLLKKVLRQNRLEVTDSWYIGDEVRDIVSAHAAGLRVMAVGWGYNTPEILEAHNPTKLIRAPAEIITVLEES
jgi:phosphoglycolate phosphatase